MTTDQNVTGGAKWVLLTCAGLWLLAAAAQFNDPDPTGWIVVYTSAAGVLLLVIWAPSHHASALGMALGTLSWSLALGPQLIFEVPIDQFLGKLAMQNDQVELARESWGLLLVTGSLVGAYLVGRRVTKQAAISPQVRQIASS